MIDIIEEHLDKITRECGDNQTLVDAARSILLAPAKRLRPLFVLHIATAYGSDLYRALDSACALELLHTYTLIHDDMPCMDNAEERRGVPAVHRAYSESTALLTGDYLLTRTYEVIANDVQTSDREKVELLQVLCQAAGGKGLLDGQHADLNLSQASASESSFMRMIEQKTADLYLLATRIGAIIGKANKEDAQTLEQFGRLFGIAFQLVDDLDDFEEEPTKLTAVSLWGFEETQHKIDTLIVEMKSLLSSLSIAIPYFDEILLGLQSKAPQS